ncbi:MAG: hypothetical protein CVV23_02270 [Ignavibacteriae bacterium HGW-Ignavibacteriae-2]|nr:metallophosphoesterase [Bacteroidota bacterium]PKL89881.1 MAG: hypothetical protein CVV23_02270 [Ignavibacteriae bacterium HGW-Ignavibacteriae-2]
MIKSFFVSDIHGDQAKYKKLIEQISYDIPQVVFIGGDILPSGISKFTSLNIVHQDFVNGFLLLKFQNLKEELAEKYPAIFLILGNDDARIEEAAIVDASTKSVWNYIHFHRRIFSKYRIFGYSFVPPSPFQLKDWEKYDVSRYVDPGCISPEEGLRTVPIRKLEARNSTIELDLENFTLNEQLENSIFLFHSPPYRTNLDRAALDGKTVDYVPLDVHIGSIAIKRFIEKKQPYITLHGHVHESTNITGIWHETIGRTHCFNAAHHGEELSIIKFDLDNPSNAERILI